MAETSRRYHNLDAMRGLAALLVATYHFDRTLVPSGYLAVDFFFALSGFVIAQNYSDRLRHAGGFDGFIGARIVRLYPLFAAGIVLGFLQMLQLALPGMGYSVNWPLVGLALLFGLLMLPSPLTPQLYPLNGVFWSVGAELFVNLVFGAGLFKVSRRMLILILAGAGLLLVSRVRAPHFVDSGDGWSLIDLTVIRAFFSFVAGMLLERCHDRGQRRTSILSLSVALSFCLILVIGPRTGWQGLYGLVAILILFPGIILLGARWEPPTLLVPPAAFLGDISYAVYATHLPIHRAVDNIARIHHVSSLSAFGLFITLTLALAYSLTRYWDMPARGLLSRWLTGRYAAKPAISAFNPCTKSDGTSFICNPRRPPLT